MRKFGLIGKRLDYSFSKTFFTEKFSNEGLSDSYENIELPTPELLEKVIREDGFSGLNVTIPYKEAVIPFLDDLSEEARAIGAVNTIVFNDGKAIGHNTDAFGFHQSIKPFLTNLHERALILGTGGASKAVAHVFRSIGLDVFFISRNPEGTNEFSYDQINDHMVRACKVIVNCTPVGTFPDVNNSPEFPFHYLTEEHLVIDLIYNPEKTRFLQESEAKGAAILNGKSMLLEQALRAWELWNNK